MNTCRNHRKSSTILVFSMLVSCLFGLDTEDTFDIHKASFFCPEITIRSLLFFYFRFIRGYSKDWTLDSIPSSYVFISGKVYIAKRFATAGRTLKSDHFEQDLGPYWNYKINDNYIGLGWNVAGIMAD